MTSERIREIQQKTAYPDSISIQQALLQVWNECSKVSQPEISDKEIEKQSKYWNETTNPEMWTFKLAWKAGAKWYREQLKNK